MAFNDPKDLLDTLSAPMGDLIASVGRGIAEAQRAMDEQTLEQIRALYGEDKGDELLRTLQQLGYQPTWYHIPEVNAELNVALSLSGATQQTAKSAASGKPAPRAKLYAAPVDASYTNRYGYELKAASVVKFRIVPVPPSPNAENLRVVPNVVGRSFAEAKATLDGLGIAWVVSNEETPKDEASVKAQTPAPSQLIPSARSVELLF